MAGRVELQLDYENDTMAYFRMFGGFLRWLLVILIVC